MEDKIIHYKTLVVLVIGFLGASYATARAIKIKAKYPVILTWLSFFIMSVLYIVQEIITLYFKELIKYAEYLINVANIFFLVAIIFSGVVAWNTKDKTKTNQVKLVMITILISIFFILFLYFLTK